MLASLEREAWPARSVNGASLFQPVRASGSKKTGAFTLCAQFGRRADIRCDMHHGQLCTNGSRASERLRVLSPIQTCLSKRVALH